MRLRTLWRRGTGELSQRGTDRSRASSLTQTPDSEEARNHRERQISRQLVIERASERGLPTDCNGRYWPRRWAAGTRAHRSSLEPSDLVPQSSSSAACSPHRCTLCSAVDLFILVETCNMHRRDGCPAQTLADVDALRSALPLVLPPGGSTVRPCSQRQATRHQIYSGTL